MFTTMAQGLAQTSFFSDWLAFKANASSVKKVQQSLLDDVLKSHPYLKNKDQFFSSPIKNYSEQMKILSEVGYKTKRYQPTSGSGDREKLIPYSVGFIKELNRGLNPWLFDLGLKHPTLLTGKHYWSLSWLPTHYREKNWQLDDFELLPNWKKNLTRVMMAVPHEVSQARTLKASQFATLAYLIAERNLTFLSVWSPTFLLKLLELLEEWRDPLEATLRSGQWALYSQDLSFIKAPRSKIRVGSPHELWPRLSVISSWDSSTSSSWAQKLKEKFPDAAFQGKGLWATEGVVTIPFEGKFLLSYLSHYYEFLELKSGDLLSAWDLKEGMEVQPVITAGNGFTRYNLKDRLQVTGFYGKIPALQFLEREQTYDMVGEKLDAHCFAELYEALKEKFPNLRWVVAFAVKSTETKPFYHFVFEGSEEEGLVRSELLELLDQRFHYHLATELGQLAPLQVTIAPGTFARYEEFQLKKGMVQGNIKVELAAFIKTESHESLYHEYFSR